MSIINFIKVQQQAIKLIEEKNYEEALILLEDAKVKFPNKLDRLGQWKAETYCLLGENEKALYELNEVLEKGLWWNPVILKNFAQELGPLKELEDFKLIIEKCREIYDLQKQSSKPDLKVKGNENAEIALFALHWKGSNTDDFSQQLAEINTSNEYLLGFPQSSQLLSHHCYSWDDPDIAKRDLVETFKQFKNRYNLKEKENVILGASQGAKVAIEMTLDQEILGVNRFIAIVPGFQDVKRTEYLIRNHSNKNIRGCIITGDKDPFYDQTLKIIDVLKSENIPCKFIVQEGMGHTLPEDFPKVFQDALDYVMN
ncbi:DUF3089 domain-containing protein [Chengkuizengella axinellae]|uniref:DUF3089 domain-containing protein n=1 Tax=Chengkuizengella axinellae TaxID=3064388 RepID=A0ABT9J0E3_9BACL|nr:DUF3089 domain-containing protein [Chengkuizengella sp. 2205SS18-9]MDP5274948.1 DUF3089 domain-containing protein [Chengkuizengella sp. 2205SS18-9]